MNRIVNLRVLPAIVAAVFFLIACSSNDPTQNDPPDVQGQGDSSSSIDGILTQTGGGGELSSASEYNKESEVTSSSSISGAVSSSSARQSSSSSSARSSSSNAQNTSSSSVRSSSASTTPPGTIPSEKNDFTETVGSVSFNMVYVPGGTFTIGCEKSSGCPADSKAVEGVTVSNYFIGKTEVTTALWNAVMGTTCSNSYMCSGSSSYTNMTWYDAMEFACKLSQLTNKNYRMTTEAEWEYAAKNSKDKLEKIGSGEEWAYNSWSSTHSGGVDPVGPSSGQHTQKTRRDAQGTSDNITGRLIRSIEGMGPALRLAVSADANFPPNYVQPCDLHAPKMEGEPANSYRDPRWITGSDSVWKTDGTIAIGNFELKVWEDGTANLKSGYGGSGSGTNGQWFTSNNIAFVFVPSSGSSGLTKYAYIFVDEQHASLISDKSFMSGGFIGRIAKQPGSGTKPTISSLQSGEELAKAQTNFNTEFKMVDMTNIPASAQQQDSRLLDGGADKGWFQNNTSAGGVHHYRKDVDPDEFRFTVNQNNGRTMLANGKWFTVNNTFLRVTHSNGYTAEYLYAVDPDGTFYHNSFMGYERGDFRMFKKETNGSSWPQTTCGNICSEEIPKGLGASMYNSMANGQSTFVPAPCPSGGCR